MPSEWEGLRRYNSVEDHCEKERGAEPLDYPIEERDGEKVHRALEQAMVVTGKYRQIQVPGRTKEERE